MGRGWCWGWIRGRAYLLVQGPGDLQYTALRAHGRSEVRDVLLLSKGPLPKTLPRPDQAMKVVPPSFHVNLQSQHEGSGTRD